MRLIDLVVVKMIIGEWEFLLKRFYKVMLCDYKCVLLELVKEVVVVIEFEMFVGLF